MAVIFTTYRLTSCQMTEMRLFYLFSITVSSDNSKVQHHHHIFCKRAGEQKMTLDFILCQSTKGTKKVEMKNASLKAFQMTNLVQQQRRRGSRAGSRFCADLHKSSNEFWVWNEARPDFLPTFSLMKKYLLTDPCRPFFSLKWTAQ